MKRLVVNADDFGMSPGVNAGIVRAHAHGIVTRASLMVRRGAAADAVSLAGRYPALALGLHADLYEWVYRDGAWAIAYSVVSPDDADAVRAELDRQLAAFRELVGRDPTHLDSHQHAHRGDPAAAVFAERARALGIPLRMATPGIRYCGEFFGQSDKGHAYPEGIGVESLLRVLRSIPEGTTELACHPGLDDDADSVYRTERGIECATLCDPRIRAAVAELGIALVSFAEA